MFDPWNSTVEEAKAAQEEWCAAGNAYCSPTAPLIQFGAAQCVMELKEKINAGDGFAVLRAVSECIRCGLVAPDWLAYAFCTRVTRVAGLFAKSWDDPKVFGAPYSKGFTLNAARKAHYGKFKVWSAISKRIDENPNTAIDKGLFEEIGKELGYGTTLTEQYYYGAVAYHKKLYGFDMKEIKRRRSRVIPQNREK